eukprot:scaffold124701_cov28-Tisochrysis_lutea.AAC.3
MAMVAEVPKSTRLPSAPFQCVQPWSAALAFSRNHPSSIGNQGHMVDGWAWAGCLAVGPTPVYFRPTIA